MSSTRTPRHGSIFPARSFALYAFLLALTLAGTARAATQLTWNGTTTTWGNGTNWIGGVAPTSDLTSNTTLFNSSTYTAQPNAGVTSIAGIEIGSGNTGGTLVITEQALSIGSSGILKDASSGVTTINGTTTVSYTHLTLPTIYSV